MTKVIESNGQSACFYCPGCEQVHYVSYASKSGPQWGFNGNDQKPTFTPSIFVNCDASNSSVPSCHSFVTDGKIQYLSDCTHALAGQTIELPEFTWGDES